MKVLICAGNGGIGQGLIKAILERHPDADISATYRNQKPTHFSSTVHWFQADLTDQESVEQLASNFSQIDWLINCAGFLHQHDDDNFQGPEKSIRQFEPETADTHRKRRSVPPLAQPRQAKRG